MDCQGCGLTVYSVVQRLERELGRNPAVTRSGLLRLMPPKIL